MLWPKPLVPGLFLHRDNRFVLKVEVNGCKVLVHLANTGRLEELLVSGRRVWLHRSGNPKRKTQYDLILVETAQGQPISIDARVPNKLFSEGFAGGEFAAFLKYRQIQAEVTVGESRLDFRLLSSQDQAFVEVKSVTLVENGVAQFPDAPTLRGIKHLRELIRLRREGHFAAVVFMVQRTDARCFSPNDRTAPAFGEILRQAQSAGVVVLAYSCAVDRTGITIAGPLEILL